MELWDGTQGQACVTGRDDDIGLALLMPIIEPRDYYFLRLSNEAPTIGDRLVLLQYSTSSSSISIWRVMVSGYLPGGIRYNYFGVQGADNSIADGAVLLNRNAEMQGMRMPSRWLLEHGIGNPGGVYAVDAPGVASFAVPILRSGRMQRHVAPGETEMFQAGEGAHYVGVGSLGPSYGQFSLVAERSLARPQ